MKQALAALLVAVLAFQSSVIVHGFQTAAESQKRERRTWERASSVPTGSRIQLTFVDGTQISGRLLEARADVIVLADNVLVRGTLIQPEGRSLKEPITFRSANVDSVRVLQTPRMSDTRKVVLITAAVAGGILAALEAWFPEGR